MVVSDDKVMAGGKAMSATSDNTRLLYSQPASHLITLSLSFSSVARALYCGWLISVHSTNCTTWIIFQQARLYQSRRGRYDPFRTVPRVRTAMDQETLRPDALSRRSQTMWNAQYPLWRGHHVREQVNLESVVTRRTVVIGNR